MVCSNHLKSKYTRFLIKYHFFIFSSALIMTGLSIGLIIYKHDQIHPRNLLRGFQAHGTKSSDDYRKFIALLRETQITHLFPHLIHSKTLQQTPYSSYNPQSNPCTKRFYLPTCPIIPYTELTFAFDRNSSTLFNDLNTFKSICQLEWSVRRRFTNCSSTTCCEYLGPVDLLFNGNFLSSDQCENVTLNQLEDYHSQWLSCQSSICSNTRLRSYLPHMQSSSIFKIYLHIPNDTHQTENLIHLYDSLHNYHHANQFHIIDLKFNANDEQSLFHYLLHNHLPLLYLTLSLYLLSLLFFVKNLFFILIILQHIFLTLICTWTIYTFFFHFPMTILNYTSITLYFFIVLIDSFLWYTCWFVNNHRRDDCPINRIIENLLTQTFYYLLPKNLTAILALVMAYSTQIIALQCFTIFSILLITISFFISFTLYPVTFICILRYQSWIPTIEHFLHRLLTTATTSCFIDRTIPCLIVRLKAFWLALFTIVACISFAIIFQWPKLQFDVCRITFDVLPFHLKNANARLTLSSKILDIDITYYIGTHWEVPNESIIPSEDIPLFDYNLENKMTSKPGDIETFEYALEKNLSQLIQFCSQLKSLDEKPMIHKKRSSYKHYSRHINAQMTNDSSFYQALIENQLLRINNVHCFGDLSPSLSTASPSTTKFSSVISNHQNHSNDCSSTCTSNKSSDTYDCAICLNSLYYNSHQIGDLFVMKNGLRFLGDAQYPRYLLQTINYKWTILTNLNNYFEWKLLNEYLKSNIFARFYSNTFTHMSVWWSSEFFFTSTIIEQLQQEKYLLTGMKFLIILIFLVLFTGVLGIFVTFTTFCNFLTCIAIFTLLNYKLTIENISYFTIVLIISSQYSVLYSISYKLAPTLFFQRENRTMYSLKQLCTTLFHLTLSIILICTPCFFASVPYLSKSAMIYTISSLISLLYSTFFLQSLLCYIGPADHTCLCIPWRLKLTHRLQMNKNHDVSLRRSSTTSRRHQRMSTSSHFVSSYFSQVFTGSTYFEGDFGAINDALLMGSRRRESSRSYQIAHAMKRNSLLTGEVIELYTPRASLAPYSHHHHRYFRQSSVPRGIPTTAPARPLYISPSVSPFSQLSIHSPALSRQHSPSPHSSAAVSSPSITGSLRPCFSAPRLQATLQRTQKPTDTLMKEIPIFPNQFGKRSTTIIQRQDAVSSTDHSEQLSAVTKRRMLKGTIIESTGPITWLKRSNSS